MATATANPAGWALFLAVRFSLLFLGFCLLRLLYRGYMIRTKFKEMKKHGIPIIQHSWLWGHLPILLQWSREYPKDAHPFLIMEFMMNNPSRFFPGRHTAPPVLYLDIWPLDLPLMVVIDPTLSTQFTQDTSLPKHEMLKEVMEPLTNGEDLNAINGEKWKFWRTHFNPGFSARNMLVLLPDVLDEVITFIRVLIQRAGANGDWGPAFQLEEDTTNLTFDVIGRAILDIRLQEQSGTPSELRTALITQGKYMTIDFDPLRFLHPVNIFRKWAMAKNSRIMRDYFISNIKRRIQGISAIQRKTVVDLAVSSLEDDTSLKSSQRMNDAFMNGLVQHLKIFLFAGYDTTASTVCWIFHNLERHPECLERLRSEHDVVLGLDPDQAAARIRDQPQVLNTLPYTTAVIKETLRLNPPSITIRQGHTGFTLTKAGFPPFPTNGFIVWDGTPGIHRNPEFWIKPNDFIPERFLVRDDDPLHPAKNAWRAFQHPPRSCIGQELAMMEMKVVLALGLRKFDIEEAWEEWDRTHASAASMVNGERLYSVGATTAHPKDGMPVHVRLRG